MLQKWKEGSWDSLGCRVMEVDEEKALWVRWLLLSRLKKQLKIEQSR